MREPLSRIVKRRGISITNVLRGTRGRYHTAYLPSGEPTPGHVTKAIPTNSFTVEIFPVFGRSSPKNREYLDSERESVAYMTAAACSFAAKSSTVGGSPKKDSSRVNT